LDGWGSIISAYARVSEDSVAGEVVLPMNLLLTDKAFCLGLIAGSRGNLIGVVAVANSTFEAKPMKRSPATTTTIIAADPYSLWTSGRNLAGVSALCVFDVSLYMR